MHNLRHGDYLAVRKQPLSTRFLLHVESHFTTYAVLLVLLYAAGLTWLYQGPSAVPDEFMFRDIAVKAQPERTWRSLSKDILHQQNDLAYGALYWLLYRALVVAFDVPLQAMRIASIALFAAIPALILLPARCATSFRKRLSLSIALLWLTFPAAWWTGKVTAPEALTMALICGSLLRLHYRPNDCFLPWLGLGIATGIKITSAPAALFCLGVQAPTWKRPLRRLLQAGATSALGFLLVNPFLMTSARVHFLPIVRTYSKTQSFGDSIRAVPSLFTTFYWEWDVLPCDGFFRWSLERLPLFLLALWLLTSPLPKRIFWSLFASFLFATASMAINPTFLGWYWFPTLVVMVSALTWSQPAKGKVVFPLMFVVVANAASQINTIRFNVGMKKSHDSMIVRRDDLQLQLQNTLADTGPIDFVYDLTDHALHFDFGFLPANKGPLTYISPSYGAFYARRYIPAKPLCGKGVLIVGQRFLRHPNIGPANGWFFRLYDHLSLLRHQATSDFDIEYVEGPCRADT